MTGRRLGAIGVLLLPVLLMTGLGIGTGYALSRSINVPKVSELATYRPDIVTEIRGTDGSIIARFAIERRFLLERHQIPGIMVKAVLAAEDARFYEHGGIDVIRIGGAALRDLASRSLAQGASTVTQQLARSVFLSPEKSFARKINEVFLTIEIEKQYSKDQILTMYLNEVYFGHGNYGVEAASRSLFGHPALELTLPEAALLAGLIQRPEAYSPIRNPELARSRRNFVLRRMAEEKLISEEERRAAAEQPITLHRAARESNVGPYFCEEIRQYLEKAYGEKGLYRHGLRVDSTLDPKIQLWAEEALRWGLRRHERRIGAFRKPRNLVAEGIDPDRYRDPDWTEIPEKDPLPPEIPAVVQAVTKSGVELRVANRKVTVPLSGTRWLRTESVSKALTRGDLVLVETITSDDGKQELIISQEPEVEGAVIIIENGSGAVRALTGGYDFGKSKFDRAVQALRQVGSAFKPIVYLTALEEGFTPADTVLDAPISIRIDPTKPPWQPQNYSRKFSGILTYQDALEHSVNVPAVRVDLLVGTRRVIETARRLGIRQNLLAYPSLALGSFEVTPMEMAAVYSVFANQGLYYTPRLIDRVFDSEGALLEENPPEAREATNASTAYVMLSMLRGVTQRGTAASAAKLKLALAGKTGTTNDFTDAWFVGTSPRYTMAVWVGHDTKKNLGPKSTGGETALPIWLRIMKKMKDANIIKESDDFDVPQGVVFVPVDLRTGYRATASCGKVVTMAFVNGTQPTDFCGDRPHSVSTLPHYLQKAVYSPKRGEPAGAEIELPAPQGAPAAAPTPAAASGAPAKKTG
ncbi:MAG: PBP1A family penicillin-binding protein [Acidobacteria bacterium]|nr:PBP1A family penicillin-binding protein [Acidobacteriota bacterium]